jgi:hypothetical protein
MRKNRYTQVGLDRLVRLKWLERVASLVLDGNDQKTIKTILNEELKESFQSKRTDVQWSLYKTITILVKVWLSTPTELDLFRLEGLNLLKRMNQHYHLAIHWGMVMAAYPFWYGVAIQTGRLLRLQGSAAASHIQRRVREQYGERETVSRRVQYILRSFVDWGVLQDTKSRGIYIAGKTLSIDDPRLIAWLTEAALHTRSNGSAPLRDLLDSPAFFPFRFKPLHAESLIAVSSRLDILRHGLDADLVMLRKPLVKGREDVR